MRQNRQALNRSGILLAALLLSLLTGCSLIDRLQRELYPTATATAVPTLPPQPSPTPQLPTEEPTVEQATPTVTVIPPTPSATASPQPTETAIPSPSPVAEQNLIYARGGSIYRGDYFGAEAVEVATIPEMEAFAFHQGMLATAHGRSVDVIDLREGSLKTFQLQISASIEYAEVHWGTSGTGLLHLALVPDSTAELFGRNVELRFLSPQDGTELGKVLIPDVSGVSVLYYNDALGRVIVIPRGPDPSFAEIEYYDTSGRIVGAFPAQGDGEASVSPDGRYLITERLSEQGAHLLLYDLTDEEGTPPRSWQHPAGSYSVSHRWSPDGRYVAYLLREGKSFSDESTKGLGLWVLSVADMQAKKVLEEPYVASSLFGWSPDGVYIVGHHRGEAQDDYWYVVRPDGGERRLLALGPQAEVLGWMPSSTQEDVPKVVVDPWRARFLATSDDPTAMAEVVAQFVAAQGKATDEALSAQVREYLEGAGWQTDIGGPAIKRLTRDIVLAQLPPMAIYVLEAGRAQQVASGNLILEARLEGNDLGLVFGVIGASSIQPAFSLLRRQKDGSWSVVWSPQGRRDWIATDGEIEFIGKGLGTLQVSGSSFGLDMGEDEVFNECHACLHRRLVAIWSRRGDAYVRQTKLKADAPLAEVIWEMTERRPYAILYECLRRVRRGLPAAELLGDKNVLRQMEELGLLAKEAHLIPEEEWANSVLFSDARTQRRFRATIEGGRVVRIERLAD